MVTLLLDAHHARVAALRLRDEGRDVLAASDDPVLAGLDDDELLRVAAGDGRVLVTENARDLDRIIRAWSGRGEHHAGVVFTSPRRFHRGSTAYPHTVVVALTALLDHPPESTVDWIHWLA